MIDVLLSNRLRGKAWLIYNVNNGRLGAQRFQPMLGIDYNIQPGLLYTRYRAWVENQQAGDQITCWIKSSGEFLGPYTYTVAQANRNRVLVLSAEDYTGDYPVYADTSVWAEPSRCRRSTLNSPSGSPTT